MKKETSKTNDSANGTDAYLATLPDETRAALENLRKKIRAAAPKATEALSFDRPAFMLNGVRLVQYWASKNHCSLYLMSPKLVEALTEDLKSYDASKSTIRFLMNKPLPAALVKKIIKACIAENEARAKAKRAKS